ncbi:probable metal-nicotianamine transporter YSL7 [Alnus glutinosa]|uniref:probable metal-nicotianamine transporter YSL7 n=1 Tax=Alnus glutinosa TaxID=3517 RepID=UPI002D77AE5C|nr:probable metal-nicotianamine transporter YSL7 [Alnus glutinosa]
MNKNGREDKVENGYDPEEDRNHNHDNRKLKDLGELSVERLFEDQEVPSWRKQLTVRAFLVSFVLSILFCFIVMKLSLTTGFLPSLSVPAGLLGFFFVNTWTKLLGKSGLLKQPFTRQENTVIQTCVVASSGIAFNGGFGSYLFGMSEDIAKQSSNTHDFKNPSLVWMIGFLFVVSFLGLFSVVPLRKIMVLDFKLTYPSGTATALLINSFETRRGAKLVKKQVRELGKFFTFSFLWGFFQWFYTAGHDCGFFNFPSLGLKAYKCNFDFNFSATYVGVGMICPRIINISLLVGWILSCGLMWPLIEKREGDWYPANLLDTDLRGLLGYKVFTAIAMILGDGLYNFLKVLGRTIIGLSHQFKYKDVSSDLPTEDHSSQVSSKVSYDDKRRTQLFLKDQIPSWFAIGGYVAIAAISTAILPHIFHQLKLYYILVIYIFAPALAFCNAYGCGLTDWSLQSMYGKLAIFTIGAWAGASHGGVLVGLAACGVMMNIVSTASDLMQDFKTGYLTLASPRSMFVSQVIGTAMGCVISPFVFLLFYKAFDLGVPGSQYPAPYALMYRNMALLGVEGFSSLPENCLRLCYGFFAAAVLINLIRDSVDKRWARFIPLPMAMAIPFYLGSYFAIDMCIGSLILFVWEKINKAKADAFGPAIASGLICGDGISTLPASILALAGVKPPICIKFLSRGTNARVDNFFKGKIISWIQRMMIIANEEDIEYKKVYGEKSLRVFEPHCNFPGLIYIPEKDYGISKQSMNGD